jgi:uncharacterized damage-inducible protein DinB
MPLRDLLLPEFDAEIAITRRTLERLPEDRPDYKPHDKSMSLVKLANHIAEMPGFGTLILTVDKYDVADPNAVRPVPPSSNAERLAQFDASAAAARALLAKTDDRALHENWLLSAGEFVIFSGSRYHGMRMFFFNHMIHHRAQLGVYLRLNDCPVPSVYGPSADETSAPQA